MAMSSAKREGACGYVRLTLRPPRPWLIKFIFTCVCVCGGGGGGGVRLNPPLRVVLFVWLEDALIWAKLRPVSSVHAVG